MKVTDLEDLMFILEFKLNQPESEVLKMAFYRARKRIKQLDGYMEHVTKAIQEGVKGLKTSSMPKLRVPKIR